MKALRSWKTTLAGVAAIALGVNGLVQGQEPAAAVGQIVVGIGLIFGKDADRTGEGEKL